MPRSKTCALARLGQRRVDDLEIVRTSASLAACVSGAPVGSARPSFPSLRPTATPASVARSGRMCDTPRDMILIAAAPLIQKAPVRHSGEGRNPPSAPHAAEPWIPACAGMTKWRIIEAPAVPDRDGIGFSGRERGGGAASPAGGAARHPPDVRRRPMFPFMNAAVKLLTARLSGQPRSSGRGSPGTWLIMLMVFLPQYGRALLATRRPGGADRPAQC